MINLMSLMNSFICLDHFGALHHYISHYTITIDYNGVGVCLACLNSVLLLHPMSIMILSHANITSRPLIFFTDGGTFVISLSVKSLSSVLKPSMSSGKVNCTQLISWEQSVNQVWNIHIMEIFTMLISIGYFWWRRRIEGRTALDLFKYFNVRISKLSCRTGVCLHCLLTAYSVLTCHISVLVTCWLADIVTLLWRGHIYIFIYH